MKIRVLTIILLGACSLVYSKPPLPSSRLNKLSGEGVRPFDKKSAWDQRYSQRRYVFGKSPASFLAENFDFLSSESKILDMGMGEGRNAVFLAQKGHMVTGIDISSVAIKKARQLAKELGVKINTVVGTLKKYQFQKASFDAIICFYYVERSLNPKILEWLKPGGILIYEAYTTKEYERQQGQGEEKYSSYLKPGELLKMFPEMTLLKYEQPLHEKQYRASIILKKREN